MNLSFSLKYNIQLSDTFFFPGVSLIRCVASFADVVAGSLVSRDMVLLYFFKSDGLWSIVFGSTDINLIGTLKRTEYGKRVQASQLSREH